MQETNETFTYTYSAQQQEELRRLRDRYLPPAETPLDQLRRLARDPEGQRLIERLRQSLD